MKSNNIGIITFYYKSINYGGNLQAYALAHYINSIGFQCEQICFDADSYVCTENIFERVFRNIFRENVFAKVKRKVIQKIKDKKYATEKKVYLDTLEDRRQAFLHFAQELIPHSKIVYTADTINMSNVVYDTFITGSDQVWNISIAKPAFFLDYVEKSKKKISYAASVALNSLTKKQRDQFKEYLKGYDAISVREKNSIDLLADCSSTKPEYVADPTFLLNSIEWDKCAAPRLVEDDYLFCYFLGGNPLERELAKEFASKYSLKIVSIPMFTDEYRFLDEEFGDIVFNDASPEQFISLIKHSKIVFTDSFHGSVFSLIYHKQFFVFNRDQKKTMSSRIESLVELFEIKDRYINKGSNCSLSELEEIEEIDYNNSFTKAEELIEFSKGFIQRSLRF